MDDLSTKQESTKNNKRIFLNLILGVFLISTSGVLARYIDMPSTPIIFWRCLMSVIILYAIVKFQGISLKFNSKKDRNNILLSGALMGFHWITYYMSLKISSVAIGMLSLYTFPVIASLLEPLYFKTKFNKIYLLMGVMVLSGIYILAPNNMEDNANIIQGIGIGVVSAIIYTFRNFLVRDQAKNYDGTAIMFYQVVVITVMLIPSLFLNEGHDKITTEYPYIILLALFCTAIGHTIFTKSLKYFSVTTCSMISSLQPIFGIILAYFFLGEGITIKTCIGGALILSTIAIEAILLNQKNKSELSENDI